MLNIGKFSKLSERIPLANVLPASYLLLESIVAIHIAH